MKKKKRVFWKVYGVFTGIGVVAVIATLIVLYFFLAAFEKSQPNHTMDEVLTLFTVENVHSVVEKTSDEFNRDSENEIIDGLKKKLSGATVSYTKDLVQYKEDRPVYTVLADGKKIATVSLCPQEQVGQFNRKLWQLDEIKDVVHRYEDITIIAPSNDTVTVNGRTLTEEDESATPQVCEDAEIYADYVSDFPMMVTYTCSDLYEEPEVLCYNGDELVEGIKDGQTYTFNLTEYECLEAERKDKLTDFVYAYVKYCMNEGDFASIEPLFIEGTRTYYLLKDVSTINMYSGRHDKIEYSDIDFSNYFIYNENAYKIQMDFTYTVILGEIQKERPTTLICYLAKIDNVWKIIRMDIS